MNQCKCDPDCPLEPGEDGLCIACEAGWCMHPGRRKMPRDVPEGFEDGNARLEEIRRRREPAVPTARLWALLALLYPEEMTPTAKRQIERVIEEYEG